MTSGPPRSMAPLRDSSSSASSTALSTSETATGWTELCIHVGTGCTRNRVATCRMISNEVDPAPITTPARSATDPSMAARRIRSTSSREAMWAESSASGTSGTSPER